MYNINVNKLAVYKIFINSLFYILYCRCRITNTESHMVPPTYGQFSNRDFNDNNFRLFEQSLSLFDK